MSAKKSRRSPKVFPIEEFETIAERIKSNRRQSVTPKRFGYEDESPERPRSGAKKTIKKEVLPKTRDELNKRSVMGSDIGFGVNSVKHLDRNSKLYFGSNRPTITPNDTIDRKDAIRLIRQKKNWSNELALKMPPKLVPIRDIDTEDQPTDASAPPPPPPTLRTPVGCFGPEFLFNNIENRRKLEAKPKSIVRKPNLELQLFEARQETRLVRKDLSDSRADCKRLERECLTLKRKVSDMSVRFEHVLAETKARHWCTVCQCEAQFFCCWYGSYCSRECQALDWLPSHQQLCKRRKSSN